MPTDQDLPVPPPHIVGRLPAIELLERALLDSSIEIVPGHQFVRAAWNEASIWPRQVQRTYRFGPPLESIGVDGRYPFHWAYVATHAITAVWEAQLCANDVTRPGTFYIRPQAAQAIIATLSFGQPLRLFDITGTTASKLGLFDEINSPDHEWGQWFGCQLDRIIVAQKGAVHGFRYPSRRHPGHSAFAISSRVMDTLASSLSKSTVKFGATEEFAALTSDACCVVPP
ncbi:MAG: RES domain-containing protein [Pseudomonadota bacterium]